MSFTKIQYEAMVGRLDRNKLRGLPDPYDPGAPPYAAAERETGHGGLHGQVQAYCRAQFPRWLVIAARTDQRSTIAEGAHDMTVFLPGGRVLCCELKAKDGKLSTAQRGWRLEMERLGHVVHIVTSLERLKELANDQGPNAEVSNSRADNQKSSK